MAGKPYKKFLENQTKIMKTWILPVDGNMYRYVLIYVYKINKNMYRYVQFYVYKINKMVNIYGVIKKC